MSSRRLSVGQGTIAALLAAPLLLAVACSGDSGDVSFDEVGGSDSGATSAGGTKTTAGSPATSAGTHAGGSDNQAGSGGRGGRGGTDTGGTDSGGTDTGGTDSGGTDTGGTDAGGTDTGGTDTGGTDTGGTNQGGTNQAGTNQGGTNQGGTNQGGINQGGTGAGMGGKDSGGMAGMGGKDSGGMGGGTSCTPKTEVCNGLDDDCDKGIDQGMTCPTGCTGATYEGHTYVFCGKVDSAEAALAKCQGLGLNVVIITSAAENTFVTGKLKGSSWLGATDMYEEKQWLWPITNDVFWDEKPIDGKYNNWSEGQPNNNGMMGAEEDCAVISTAAATKGEWNDLSCTSTGYSVACESVDSTN